MVSSYEKETVCKLALYDVVTVEPPIRDPPREGRPLNQGFMYYLTSEIGTTFLYTVDKSFGPMVSLVRRFHCITLC